MVVLTLLMQTASAEEIDSKITNFLTDTGFVAEDFVREDLDKPISRGDFVDMASGLMPAKGSVLYTAEEQRFSDVSAKDARYQSIMYMADSKIVNGVSAVEFAPGNEMKFKDACAVMVRILGYNFNQTDNFVSEAEKYGIIRGIKISYGSITKGDALKMMYNMLFIDLDMDVKINGIRIQEDGLMMTERFGIYEVSGVVQDDGVTSLTGTSVIGKGNIKIGNTVFANNVQGDFLGCNVKAYYKETETDNTIIHIYASEAKNDVEMYDADDISDFDGSSYTVYTDEKHNKTQRKTLSTSYKIIYNTVAVNEGLTQADLEKYMNPDCGSVKLIDSNNDGKFDVVIVVSYETIIVNSYASKGQIVYNKYDTPKSMGFENIETVDVVDASGRYMSLENLAENDVLSVMSSLDGSYAKIIISKDYAEGTMTSYGPELEDIKIADKIYEGAKELSALITVPRVGTEVKALLRHDGKIVYFISQAGKDGLMCYIRKAKYDENEDKIHFTLFDENKEVKKVCGAEKLIIDGKPYTTGKSAIECLETEATGIGDLVLMKFNEAGEVTSIDLPYKDGAFKSGESKVSWHVVDDLYKKNGQIKAGILESKIATDESTKVFIVNENGDINECSIASIYAPHVSEYGARYTYTAYTTDDDTMLVQAIIIYRDVIGYDITNTTVAEYRQSAVVTDIKQVVNGYDEICWEFTITYGAYETTVKTKTLEGNKCFKSGDTVKIGDAIRYGTDKAGYIPDGQLVIMYSPERDKTKLRHDNGSFDSNLHTTILTDRYGKGMVMGKANQLNERFIRIHNLGGGLTGTADQMSLFGISSMKYIVYDDSETPKVRFGNWNDIVTEQIDPTNSDVHIFNLYEGALNYIYIIK